MNTVSAENSVKATPDIALRDAIQANPVEPKITAEQIKMGCPARLQHIGDEITEHFKRAQDQARLLDKEVAELQGLIEEARGLCDKDGFEVFRQKFFPNLRKSRVYELLAIASGKRSAKETKARNRERQAKHRAKQAAPVNSVTITENLEEGPLAGPPEHRVLAAGMPSAPEQPPQLAKPRSKAATGDQPLIDFSMVVLELVRRTSNKDVARFARTSVPARDLTELSKFLADIANLKRSEVVKPTPVMAPHDDGTGSAEQLAEDVDTDAELDGACLAPMQMYVHE